MKLLVWSDIQFNNWQEFHRTLPNGLNSRFQDQLNVQEEIFDYAHNNGIEVMVHCGDFFESLSPKIDKAMYMTAFDRFSEFAKKSTALVILLVGNHDWIDRTEQRHVLTPFKKIENIVVVDSPLWEVIGDTFLGFVPYTRVGFKQNVNGFGEAP